MTEDAERPEPPEDELRAQIDATRAHLAATADLLAARAARAARPAADKTPAPAPITPAPVTTLETNTGANLPVLYRPSQLRRATTVAGTLVGVGVGAMLIARLLRRRFLR